MENTVTRREENAVAGMARVRHITSTITEGSSVTAVEFRLETDTDRAVNGVQQVKRLRPILMTTIAMVAGMVPAVFASGAGAAFRAPMAIAVICGLTTSTLLSLVFVPVVYSLMDDLREYLAPKLAKLTSVTVEDRARK